MVFVVLFIWAIFAASPKLGQSPGTPYSYTVADAAFGEAQATYSVVIHR